MDVSGLMDTQLIDAAASTNGSNGSGNRPNETLFGSDEQSSDENSDKLLQQQQITDPDTVIVGPSVGRSVEEEVVEDADEASESSEPFKHLQLPNADSPWLSRIADPFEDTPVVDRVRGRSLRETPVQNRFIYAETPDTVSRSTRPAVPFTPHSDSAHGIFQRLRDNQAQPELEIDTQPLPSLEFDTQEEDATKTPRTVSVPSFGAHYADIPDVSVLDENTVADVLDEPSSANVTVQQEREHINETSQAAIQIPGTAPDEHTDSHDEDNMDISSPVVSEDEESGGDHKNDSSEPNRSFTFQAEDSLQVKRDRDLTNRTMKSSPLNKTTELQNSWNLPQSLKTNSFPVYHGSEDTPARSDFLVMETPSKEGHRPTNINTMMRVESSPSLMRTQADTTSHDDHSLLIEEPQPPPPQSSVKISEEGDYNELVAVNITQELSDIDDESRVNVTVEAEDPSILEMMDQEDDEDHYGVITKSRARTRKRKTTTMSTSQTPIKFQRHASPSSSELSLLVTQEPLEEQSNSSQFIDPTQILQLLPKQTLKQDTLILEEHDMVFKSSVWFLYQTYYYPGIVIGGSSNGKLVVKFNDREQAVSGVVPLDLRIGDQVFHEDAAFRIIGLECVSQSGDTIRCMRGYDTVIVQPLKRTKRKKNISKRREPPSEWRLALQDIKMSEEDWLKVDRVGSEQEFSRRRAPVKPHVTFEDELIQQVNRKPLVYDKSLLFSGCIFALTDLDDRKKSELEKLIMKNGGLVADDGFEQYMRFSHGRSALVPNNSKLSDLSFAALITTRTNRYPKFFECLSLGWPVLSYEYLEHCVQQNKLLTNLYTYLLPSGISAHLHNTVKSADISQFVKTWQTGSSLDVQLQNNTVMHRSVVLITENEPKISEFLFHALGAETRLIKLTTNTRLLADCEDDETVYVYAKSLKKLHSELKQNPVSKRKSMTTTLLGNKQVEVEIIDWEWLVQCIISGHAWDSIKITINN